MNAATLAGLDPFENVLSQCRGVKRRGADQASALCPAHDDQNPSLSVTRDDEGKALVHCFRGCSTEDIVAAIGLTLADLYPDRKLRPPQIVATYPYRDGAGPLLYDVVRYEPKDFRQRRPDGHGGWIWNLKGTRRVLYRLPEWKAADPDEWRLYCEGEKDTDRARAEGFTATTNAGGAGKWRGEYADHCRGLKIAIIPHNDDPGWEHARKVANALVGIAASVKVVELPLGPRTPNHGKDLSDWFDAGAAPDQLRALIDQTPEWGERPLTPEERRILELETQLAETQAALADAERQIAERDHRIAQLEAKTDRVRELERDRRDLRAIKTLIATPDDKLSDGRKIHIIAAGFVYRDTPPNKDGSRTFTNKQVAAYAGRRWYEVVNKKGQTEHRIADDLAQKTVKLLVESEVLHARRQKIGNGGDTRILMSYEADDPSLTGVVLPAANLAEPGKRKHGGHHPKKTKPVEIPECPEHGDAGADVRTVIVCGVCGKRLHDATEHYHAGDVPDPNVEDPRPQVAVGDLNQDQTVICGRPPETPIPDAFTRAFGDPTPDPIGSADPPDQPARRCAIGVVACDRPAGRWDLCDIHVRPRAEWPPEEGPR